MYNKILVGLVTPDPTTTHELEMSMEATAREIREIRKNIMELAAAKPRSALSQRRRKRRLQDLARKLGMNAQAHTIKVEMSKIAFEVQ